MDLVCNPCSMAPLLLNQVKPFDSNQEVQQVFNNPSSLKEARGACEQTSDSLDRPSKAVAAWCSFWLFRQV